MNNVGIANAHPWHPRCKRGREGIFTVNGTFNNILLKKAGIKIYNAAGRMVYSNVADIVNGKLDTRIQLDAYLPGGIYLLQVSTGDYKSNLLHFAVEK